MKSYKIYQNFSSDGRHFHLSENQPEHDNTVKSVPEKLKVAEVTLKGRKYFFTTRCFIFRSPTFAQRNRDRCRKGNCNSYYEIS